MPGNILNADTEFPNLTEKMTNNEKMTKIMNYLYMLLEQLRYNLSNLGVQNFNEAEITELAKIINEPIYIQLADDEGNIQSLSVTAQQLSNQISTAEGNISTLTQTANGLSSRMTTAEGNISTVTQTAAGLSSRVTSAEGNISSLSQTVNGITLTVSTSGSSSTFKIMSGSTELTSAILNLSGYVTFTNLADNNETTVINGGALSTSTISATDISGGTISGTTVSGSTVKSGTLRGNTLWSHNNYSQSYEGNGYDGYSGQTVKVDSGEVEFSYIVNQGLHNAEKHDFGSIYADYTNSRIFFTTENNYKLKLQSDDNMSLEADGLLYILADGTGQDGQSGITIRVPTGGGEIRIQDNSGTVWKFSGGNFYKGNTVIA